MTVTPGVFGPVLPSRKSISPRFVPSLVYSSFRKSCSTRPAGSSRSSTSAISDHQGCGRFPLELVGVAVRSFTISEASDSSFSVRRHESRESALVGFLHIVPEREGSSRSIRRSGSDGWTVLYGGDGQLSFLSRGPLNVHVSPAMFRAPRMVLGDIQCIPVLPTIRWIRRSDRSGGIRAYCAGMSGIAATVHSFDLDDLPGVILLGSFAR